MASPHGSRRHLDRIVLLALIAALLPAWSTQAAAPKPNTGPVAAARKARGIEARIVWVELSANLKQWSTREGIAASLDRMASAGVNTVIVEAKNAWAFVNYQSAIAPHISQSPLDRSTSPYEYSRYPAPNTGWFDPDFDQLQVLIEEAHRREIDVHAAVNTFAEGLNAMSSDPVMRSLAPAYKYPEWQSIYWVGVRQVQESGGATLDLSGTNQTRQADQLVLFSTEYYRTSPPNRFGVDVYVVNNTVVEIRDRAITGAGPIPVGSEGYVLSAHGAARAWVLTHIQVGDTIDIGAARGKFVHSGETGTFAFVNPHLREVRDYELSIIREIVTNYDVDGLVLDRSRFNNIAADFSPTARARFESYIGRSLSDSEWPHAIFGYRYVDGTGFQRVEGPLYKQWLEFRAATIQSYVREAHDLVASIDRDVIFSNYVGGWYPEYWNEGVNWGATTSPVSYEWMTPTYHQRSGTAELYDYLMTGQYYRAVTEQEAVAAGAPAWRSVEGGSTLANQVIDDKTFHLASLFLLDYAGDPEQFRRAVRMAADTTHGVMLFDLIYIEVYDWWSILEEEWRQPAKAPYTIPGLLRQVRAN